MFSTFPCLFYVYSLHVSHSNRFVGYRHDQAPSINLIFTFQTPGSQDSRCQASRPLPATEVVLKQ